MTSLTKTAWDLMHGYRRPYLAAIGAMVAASCFLYLDPLIPQVVIDGILMDSDQPSAFLAIRASTTAQTNRRRTIGTPHPY